MFNDVSEEVVAPIVTADYNLQTNSVIASKTSVLIHRTARPHVPEDGNLHTRIDATDGLAT